MKLIDLFEQTGKGTTKKIAKPYIIAEAGVNHEGSMERAKQLIEEAQKGGANAIKFQTYKAETLAAKDSPAYWDTNLEPTKNQYELFKKHDKFWKSEFEALKQYCDQVGIEFLSTPFDIESANFLNEMMVAYKISSSDLTNLPFIKYICQFNKPILLSTGASNLDEIQEAVKTIESSGNDLCLLHCILNYPTAEENANLGMIVSLREHFPETLIGYSDHTMPGDMQNLLTATLLGAKVLEKHFTYDKNLPGNDHYHAMDYQDLLYFHEKFSRIEVTLGNFDKIALRSEEPARKNARRSLVAAKTIPSGKTITHEDLTWKRPASGISPKKIDLLIGKKALKEIPEDTILQMDMFDIN